MDKEHQRSWSAVEFEVFLEQEDLASWLVMHCGATGCEIQSLEGSRVLVHAIFDQLSVNDISRLTASFEVYGLSACLKSLQLKKVLEEDWLAEWRKGFQPIAIGEKLLVCPSWLRESLSRKEVGTRKVFLIEPGMAFGTGLHATTQYCLQALERFPIGESILDVGTGSGILAVGAALLYPDAQIVAVDVDPVAIRVAQENIELNDVVRRIQLIEGSTEVFGNQAFDCIVSNLTCEDILALLLEYLRLLRPEGMLICAGILKEKLDTLERALTSYPLSVIDKEVGETWVGVTLKRIPVALHSKQLGSIS